eukprot:gene23741-14949_t
MCGDLGCTGLMRYSFIGDAAAWPSHAARGWALWHVCGPHDPGTQSTTESGDEWVYQMQRHQLNDPWRSLNAAMEAFHQRDFGAAMSHVAAGRAALPHAQPPDGPVARELCRVYDELAGRVRASPSRTHAVVHDAHLVGAADGADSPPPAAREDTVTALVARHREEEEALQRARSDDLARQHVHIAARVAA